MIERELVGVAIAFDVTATRARHYASVGTIVQHEIDDAGNRIRTVLRGCTVSQDFDAFDGTGRDAVEIRHERAQARRDVEIER